MIQFYAPDIETTLTLPESDSGHCIRVLRMRIGDRLPVVDGSGHRYTCEIIGDHPKHVSVAIVEKEDVVPVWSNSITIMVAPTKNNDRMEWLVEKLVEIGVNRIVPIRCRRSERKEVKRDRLVKIAVSAMKQSLKATLPEITEMMTLAEAVGTFAAPQCFVGYCDEKTERALLSRTYKAGEDVVILIGPEGDFAPEEIEHLLASGYIPVTMGDNRLRTETAALVACDTCHIINQLTL
ncbi:MAG: 16S rRNA (uracil(1498)-N(3))-methyltransferase [Muribaculaceae bacterium]|nr:16S rRNA (uracil(1498)-N(3))-methyltransferase [Muribaculaceae bacterium]